MAGGIMEAPVAGRRQATGEALETVCCKDNPGQCIAGEREATETADP